MLENLNQLCEFNPPCIKYTGKTFLICAGTDFSMRNRIPRILKPIDTYRARPYMHINNRKKKLKKSKNRKKKWALAAAKGGGAKNRFLI